MHENHTDRICSSVPVSRVLTHLIGCHPLDQLSSIHLIGCPETYPTRNNMSLAGDLTTLVTREATASEIQPSCELGNEYDGRLGLRIVAIFVILLGSSLGACFPIFAKRNKGLKVPEWTFFVAKYFGSGVIVATAFIHLLAPAHEAMSNPCLTGPITEYPWVEGIMMMTVFVLFFVELMVMRYARFGDHEHSHEHSEGHAHATDPEHEYELHRDRDDAKVASKSITLAPDNSSERRRPRNAHVPGEDHLGHQREHQDDEENNNGHDAEDYAAQMTAIFILEFGIVFHSIFIGLTLAVAGEEFKTLFAVLVFHQTFEGLGLGSRLAVTPWPKTKKWTAYILALAYGLSTPIAIAVGLGIRNTYPPESSTTLIVNGVFDSISAGILIYTGLVELMAHEFMFSHVMRKAKLQVVLGAFGLMCLGAALMALLGKWA
jgi:solute carrier family 39 (zinc transporter), member 1/2/3